MIAPPNVPSFLRLFFGLKWRMANNHLADMRRHLWVHFTVAMGVLFVLIAGGTIMFNMVFTFLQSQQPFGPPLMNRLIRMVLLAFFAMLIFSNLIITMTTTYISREVEFLMSQPVTHRRLFFGKLGESIVYSSWAFVILSFPLFVALGRSRHLDWWFYVGAVGLIVPYMIVPATIGAILALVMTAWFPPRQTIRFTLALLLLGMILAATMSQLPGVVRAIEGQDPDLAGIMQFLGMGDLLFLPSSWLGRGLLDLENGYWSGVGLWSLALWSTALMGLVACDWLAGPLYYRGWCDSRTSGTSRRTRRGGLYGTFDRLLRRIPPATRALISKDLTIFWRDPAQWSQLMILFGLLYIYMSVAGRSPFSNTLPFWQSLVALFNIGATGFVLSILTTRFVYPMLSLEGKQQWVIGLAPMGRTRIVWVKLILCSVISLALTLPLAALSCHMLQTDRFVTILALVTVTSLSLGLNALAVGLGGFLPNFGEDNPSRIANGLGGTLNAIASLIYVGLTLVLEAPWVYIHSTGRIPDGGWSLLILNASIPLWVVLQLGTIAVPLSIGLTHWRRIEF